MGYIHIMAYCGLKAMPNVSVHPDGYMVNDAGGLVSGEAIYQLYHHLCKE